MRLIIALLIGIIIGGCMRGFTDQKRLDQLESRRRSEDLAAIRCAFKSAFAAKVDGQ